MSNELIQVGKRVGTAAAIAGLQELIKRLLADDGDGGRAPAA